MGAARLLDLWGLGVLLCLAVLAVARGVELSARGVRMFPVDRERTLRQALLDLTFLLGFGLWLYETSAGLLPLSFHVAPAPLVERLFDFVPLRAAGVATMTLGLVVYAGALAAFGASWRIGIDRERAGALVTGGVFAHSRNPVYAGLVLLAAGSALALATPLHLLLAVCFPLYLRALIAREEAFLDAHYGDAYREYAARTARWWGRS